MITFIHIYNDTSVLKSRTQMIFYHNHSIDCIIRYVFVLYYFTSNMHKNEQFSLVFFFSIECFCFSWMFNDVLRKSHILCAYDAVGYFLFANINS